MEYGWEPYLSERDKKHSEIWGKKELNGFGDKPALVLIDIYYSVLGLKREDIFESMKTWRGSTGLEGWEAVDRTAELLAVARATGVPVIHVKGLHTGVAHWGRRKRAVSTMPKEMVEKGQQIVDEVKPLPGELVIEKAAPSAFQGTPLAFHLQALGIDTVIVCGETTSGCVRASVVDGATARFRMVPVVLAISLSDVPRFIRLQRSMVLGLRTRAYIDAARTVKASQFWLMTRHIIPNTIAPLLVAASIAAANAILVEAGLSFLGLGIMPPAPSLGNLIRDGQSYLEQAWWISTLPGVVILLFAIGLHFLSDGIRQVLDPRSRK